MKKSTKGAVAAAAAGVLLLGGAGSLAYWTAGTSVSGSDINSGKLTLTDTTPAGTCADAPWTLDSTVNPGPGGETFDPALEFVVPGDTLTKLCTFTVGALGTHLHASITPTAPTNTGTLTPATVAGTFEIAGTAVTDITEANDGNAVTAKIVLTFPYGTTSDNTSQTKVANLTAYSVALKQIHD